MGVVPWMTQKSAMLVWYGDLEGIYPCIGPFDDFLAYPDPAPELFLHFSHLHRTLNPFQPRSYPFMRCVLMERVVWP